MIRTVFGRSRFGLARNDGVMKTNNIRRRRHDSHLVRKDAKTFIADKSPNIYRRRVKSHYIHSWLDA